MAELDRISEEAGGSFIASMIAPEQANPFPIKPYLIQSLPLSGGDREIRVGIMGVSPAMGESGSSVTILDAREALEKYVPIVDEQSDIVVLLTRLRDPEISRLAEMFPSLDVIINGSPVGEGRTLGKMGRTIVVESSHNGISLGVLELSWDGEGNILSFQNQFIPLPPMMQESPVLAEIVDKSQLRLMEFYRRQAEESPPVAEPSIFAGAGACRECHDEAFRVWEASAHAHAVDSLSNNLNQYNPDCLPCHVTAFEVDRGFSNMLRTPELANIQCEACHSAALEHSKDPENLYPGIGILQQTGRTIRPSFCLRCHDQDNSPAFDYDLYWPKIAH